MKCSDGKKNYHQMDVELSFDKLIQEYADRIESENSNFKKMYYSALLQAISKDGFPNAHLDASNINDYKVTIDLILSELFPTSLTFNEIKAATIPFSSVLFNCTGRLKKILDDAGDEFEFNFLKAEDFDRFRLACGQILSKCYGKKLDLGNVMHAEIPDKNGNRRTYRITYNADFITVSRKKSTKLLSDEDINDLLRYSRDEDKWREAFPEGAYKFKGFGIISFTDVTVDTAISELKTALLNQPGSKLANQDNFKDIFKKNVQYGTYSRWIYKV